MTIIRSYLPLKLISLECRTSILKKEIQVSQIDSIPFTYSFNIFIFWNWNIVIPFSPFLSLPPILPMHMIPLLTLKSWPTFSLLLIYIYIISHIILYIPKYTNITFSIQITFLVCMHDFRDEHLELNNQLGALLHGRFFLLFSLFGVSMFADVLVQVLFRQHRSYTVDAPVGDKYHMITFSLHFNCFMFSILISVCWWVVKLIFIFGYNYKYLECS